MADYNHQFNSNITKDIRSSNNSSMQRHIPTSINGPFGDSIMQNCHPANSVSYNSVAPVAKSDSMPSDRIYNPVNQNSATVPLLTHQQHYMVNKPQTSIPNYPSTVNSSLPPHISNTQAEIPAKPLVSQSHPHHQQQQQQSVQPGVYPMDHAGIPSGIPPMPGYMLNGPPRPMAPVVPQMRSQNQFFARPPPYGLHSQSTPSVVQPLGEVIGASPTPSDSRTNSSLEPTSCKSSRNPSPIPTQRYDAMEGQFSSRPSPSTSCANLPVLNNSQTSAMTTGHYSTTNVYQRSAVGHSMNERPPQMNYSATTSSEMMMQHTAVASTIGATTYSTSHHPPNTSAQDMSFPDKQGTAPIPVKNVPHGMPVHPPPSNTSQGLIMTTNTDSISNNIPTSGVAYNLPPLPANSSVDTSSNSYSGVSQFNYPTSSQGPLLQRPSIVNSRRQYPQQPTGHQSNFLAQGNIHSLQGPNPPAVSMSNSTYAHPHLPNNSSSSNISHQNTQQIGPNQLAQQLSYFNFQGSEAVDLMQHRNILPPVPLEPPKIVLPHQDYNNVNCSPDIFRCTLTKIPGTQSLLQKSRLPLGILIHPFKDLNHLAVIQCATIVRCRSCRTYINPFVSFVDSRRWKCNLCFRVNELPEEFLYDPVSKTYGDPSRRPEVKSATIEFIAPSEYMLRPPQPAVYLFLMDVSHAATETGYLQSFCNTLLEELDKLPGDSRTQVGFITFDSSIHFYNLAEGLSQPQMIVVSDVEDVFLPSPDNLLVNLHESKELVQDLLHQLPVKFLDNQDTESALGAALQAAYKLVSPTGGRVTVIQTTLPNRGPGGLKLREDPNQRSGKDVHNIGPANDFYKKLSLDCSGQQIAVDLFIVASQYVDIATIACISKYSGGSIQYYPGFHSQTNPSEVERFENDMKRYLSRKVGFEAVMRIRCSKGLAIHTFHGNFFVRSTDLLSLPNINPDAGFGMQVSIEEQLTETNTACFQAALLYTSSKGERRIRVHTLCLGVTGVLNEVLMGADQQAIVSLLTKMAVDRTLMSSLTDARDALINASIDPLWVYKNAVSNSTDGLVAPLSLRLLPLYILAILKHKAFRIGTCTKLDERVYAMNQMKTLPLPLLLLSIYPNLYPVHALDEKNVVQHNEKMVPQPPFLQLSSEKIDSHGAYVLDTGECLYLYVCRAINDQFCRNVLKASNFASIDEKMIELPELDTTESQLMRNFISHLQSQRPFHASLHVIREDSKSRFLFMQHLIEDRSESAFSYYELLQHLKQRVRDYK